MASSVATPLERRFGRIAGLTEMTSTSTLGSTSITLQFDLDRDVDAAARDVQAAIAAAGGELPPNLPLKPTYRKVNPADSPILIISLDERDAAARRRSSTPPTPSSRRRSPRCTASARSSSAAASSPRCACRSIRRRSPAWASSTRGRAERARRDDGRRSQGHDRGSRCRRRRSHANDQLFDAPRLLSRSSSRRTGRRRRSSGTSRTSSTTSRTTASPAGPTAQRAVAHDRPQAARRQHHRDQRARHGAAARAGDDRSRPRSRSRSRSDRTQTIRASVHDVEKTLVLSVVLVVVVVFLFLRSGRATLVP